MNQIGTRAVLNPQLAAGVVQLQSSLETPQRTDDVFLYWNVKLQLMLRVHTHGTDNDIAVARCTTTTTTTTIIIIIIIIWSVSSTQPFTPSCSIWYQSMGSDARQLWR